jgi:hypothetical protein
MDTGTAINHAYRLQSEWVGKPLPGTCYNLDRVHASMLQESRWNRVLPGRVTAANARETRGALILLGKVRKALREDSPSSRAA